jgi:ankyrin repeat protein
MDPGQHAARELVEALQYNNFAKVQQILQENTMVMRYFAGERQSTPLHLACHKGVVAIIKTLLDLGCSVDAANEAGNTPLHFACLARSVESVSLLLAHRANVDASNIEHETPLHFASWRNAHNVVKLLLDHRAACNVKSVAHLTPLALALQEGHTSSIEMLLDNGGELAITGYHGTLQYACSRSNFDTLAALIARGVDVNARDDQHNAPLHIASANGFASGAKLLIESAADLHMTDRHLDTPLHIAARGNNHVIDVLIDGGAYLHLRNVCWACQHGSRRRQIDRVMYTRKHRVLLLIVVDPY